MRIMGISDQQSKIVKGLKKGKSYFELSEELGISEDIVILEEMRAMAILSRRWGCDEIGVIKMLCITVLIMLSLSPMFDHVDAARFTRTKTAKTRTSKSRSREFEVIEI